MFGARRMKRARAAFEALALAFALGAMAAAAHADSWALPEKRTYYSPNKRFAFEVTPKKLESQLKYFSDKVEGKPDAGAPEGSKGNRCQGAFLVRRGNSYSRAAAFALVNEVAPVSALVADSGRYVITFDNWHAVGYGPDVVVIYRADGTLVRKLGLEDFLTEKDIETLPRSVSSIWWGGEHRLDEQAGHLVLRVVSSGWERDEEKMTYHELRIVLDTGNPLEPKRDLFAELHRRMFPSYVGWAEADEGDGAQAPEGGAAPPNEPPCLPGGDAPEARGVARLASAALLARAEQKVEPVYPPIAKVARATGKVVVEVLVEEGGVACARAVSGHPLLRQAAVTAARKWKFKPLEQGGRQFGRIAFHFGHAPPDGNDE
ncbi:MAG TPA: TonB family protein [Pyrinomonadaceae bacterium]|nr:TonB family protein [Pyrinomonadaceae bacterium]